MVGRRDASPLQHTRYSGRSIQPCVGATRCVAQARYSKNCSGNPMNTSVDSLEEKVGQLFCCGWQGASPGESRSLSAHARAIVEELRVGGVILMGRNLGAPEEVAALVGELQALSATPLWIGIDQE